MGSGTNLASELGVVVSLLRILPSPAQRREVLDLLRSVEGPTVAHPGCLACRIYKEDRPDRAILLFEEWTSSAAFREHVRSEVYRPVLAALDLSSQPPEVRIHHISSGEGMELIHELRSRCEDSEAVSEAAENHQS